jgi:hypothetical protein
MSYLSPAYLQRYDISNFSNSRYIIEAKEASIKADVFLSHSNADDEHIERVVLFFREFNAVAYADNYDESLPDPPDIETAAMLKVRIRITSRFVVLVSPNSRDSRWIPWEIGVADGNKGVAQIAILPITPSGNEDAWTEEQYFGLYPRIKQNSDCWNVFDPRDKKVWTLKFGCIATFLENSIFKTKGTSRDPGPEPSQPRLRFKKQNRNRSD